MSEVLMRPMVDGYYWLLEPDGNLIIASVDVNQTWGVEIAGNRESFTLEPSPFCHIEGLWVGPLVPPPELLGAKESAC